MMAMVERQTVDQQHFLKELRKMELSLQNQVLNLKNLATKLLIGALVRQACLEAIQR